MTMENTTQNMESNMSKLDSRTEEEKQADAELACMVKEATRSYTLRREALESEYAQATQEANNPHAVQEARYVRKLIAECDKALMTLQAGRLP
jgi:hypothetical protein